jgi:hypothetical protein
MVDNNPRTTNLNDYLQGFTDTPNITEDGHDITYSSSSDTTMSCFPLKVKFDFSPIYMSPLTFKNNNFSNNDKRQSIFYHVFCRTKFLF